MRTSLVTTETLANRKGEAQVPLTADELDHLASAVNVTSCALHGEELSGSINEMWEAKKAGDPVAIAKLALLEAFAALLDARDQRKDNAPNEEK